MSEALEQEPMEQQEFPESAEQSEAEPQESSASPVDAALEALEANEPEGGEPEGKVEDESESEQDNAEEDEQGPETSEQNADGEEDAEDDLTPPEGLSKRASERFQRLASQVKKLREQVEAERTRAEGVVSMLKETGATPEELGQTLEFVTLAKKGDPDSLRQAAQIARQWLAQVSTALGEPIEIDPVAEHADLKERVEAGELTPEDAMQIARARAMEQQRTQQAQMMQMQQAQMAAFEQEKAQAIQAVSAMEEAWAKSDPDFPAKREIIMSKLEEIAGTMPPAMWPEAVRLQYEATTAAMAKAKPKTETPIFASGTRPEGAKPEPKDAVEAAMAALGDL